MSSEPIDRPRPGAFQASVVVPTYNRASNLSRCLDAIAALRTDPRIFEIIVVDNNSPDPTRDVTLGFAAAHPHLHVRYVNEPQQGCSAAKNRGVAESGADIVCFLDDDSPPEPEWLDALLAAFEHPDVGCAGGPALLDFQGQDIPPWLRGDLQGLLSGYGLAYTTPTAVATAQEFPFSCNLAIRRQLFTTVGLFRTDLGKSGGELLAGGETELLGRICRAGWKVMYIPAACVSHLVAPSRLDISYIYRRSHGLAASHVILTSDRRPLMVARWFASDGWFAMRMLFRLVTAVVGRKEGWFDDYMRLWAVGLRLPLRVKAIATAGWAAVAERVL